MVSGFCTMSHELASYLFHYGSSFVSQVFFILLMTFMQLVSDELQLLSGR